MPARDLLSWNSITSMHAKVGELVAARQIFNEMQERNVITWSIMIDGFVHHGNPKKALNLFRQMLCEGIIDKVSVVGAILVCAQLGALNQGRWIHVYMKKQKITMDVVVQSALVDMYPKRGSPNEALSMFNCMSEGSIVSWNVLLVGLGMNGFGGEALKYFYLMELKGIQMDDLIFLGALAACCHAGMVSEGLRISLKYTDVRYVMRCIFGDPKQAPPPLEKLTPEETVSFIWKGDGSLVEELLLCMSPYMDANMLNGLKSKACAHDPSDSDDIQKALQKSLLWLRDEVRILPCTYKCRHDAAAGLIHVYAYTKNFFREYDAFTSPPVHISRLDLGPKCADKLGAPQVPEDLWWELLYGAVDILAYPD